MSTTVVTERWVRERVGLKTNQLRSAPLPRNPAPCRPGRPPSPADAADNVRSLILPGSHEAKITHLGGSLQNFVRLKNVDLSCNNLVCLEGLEHLAMLERLNLYMNRVPDLTELFRLRHNAALVELDVRLNPVSGRSPEYRCAGCRAGRRVVFTPARRSLCLAHLLPALEVLDTLAVSPRERKAGAGYFTSDQVPPAPRCRPCDVAHCRRCSSSRLRHCRRARPHRTSNYARVGCGSLTRPMSLCRPGRGPWMSSRPRFSTSSSTKPRPLGPGMPRLESRPTHTRGPGGEQGRQRSLTRCRVPHSTRISGTGHSAPVGTALTVSPRRAAR